MQSFSLCKLFLYASFFSFAMLLSLWRYNFLSWSFVAYVCMIKFPSYILQYIYCKQLHPFQCFTKLTQQQQTNTQRKKRYFKINSRNPNFFQIKFFVVDITVIDHVPFTKQNIAPVTYSFNLRFKFIAIRYPWMSIIGVLYPVDKVKVFNQL